ncbi:MAG: bi-domain-containing oxidoreductase [Candidatus Helarchaeota archaeon]
MGDGIEDLKKWDKVACAGAGIANHAEYVVIPRNLVMKVPDKLDLKHASTVALGGIAMQGVRRGNFKIGEFVAVIGLGFIGQLTVQMLTISGCRVIAMDIDDRRCKIAKKHGAEIVLNSRDNKNIEKKVIKTTDGYGVDGVIFTAATNEPSVISSAFKMCRRKGKVVLVGVAGNKINRRDLYKKELDFLISTSYGPGRYDDNYELKGIDYPYAYVRWTENRNMEEYLRLLDERKIVIDDLIEKIYPIYEAATAYEELQKLSEKPIVALFKYSENKEAPSNKIELKPVVKRSKEIINVAIIGAGAFAKGTHIPNLLKLKDKYNIYAICTRNSVNAAETAKKCNASVATTDYNQILSDKNVDMVMICTRHNLHAVYSIKALKAGKSVLCEKPMAINIEELEELTKVIEETKLPYIVGFNRRFSPFAKEIKKHISDRINPMIITYRMNAGYKPLDAWVHEDGGRIIGEGCHIIDLFNYFTESQIESISFDKITPNTKAISPTDNVSINLKYKDGSVANLIYTALGNSKYPKENMELYCDNIIYKMTDYIELEIFGDKITRKILKKQDKGHLQELMEFYDVLIGENENLPISLDDMVQTTKGSFLI